MAGDGMSQTKSSEPKVTVLAGLPARRIFTWDCNANEATFQCYSAFLFNAVLEAGSEPRVCVTRDV